MRQIDRINRIIERGVDAQKQRAQYIRRRFNTICKAEPERSRSSIMTELAVETGLSISGVRKIIETQYNEN